MVSQGEIYWVDLGKSKKSGHGYKRPTVVVQNDLFNQSEIGTVVVCVITKNLRLASAPGNVLIEKREGGLKEPSVVNVSQIVTVDKEELGGKVGGLGDDRVREILDGIFLLLEPI